MYASERPPSTHRYRTKATSSSTVQHKEGSQSNLHTVISTAIRHYPTSPLQSIPCGEEGWRGWVDGWRARRESPPPLPSSPHTLGIHIGRVKITNQQKLYQKIKIGASKSASWSRTGIEMKGWPQMATPLLQKRVSVILYLTKAIQR